MSLWVAVNSITHLSHKIWPSGVTLAWKQGVRSVTQKAFPCIQYVDTYVITHPHKYTHIHCMQTCTGKIKPPYSGTHTHAHTQIHSKVQVIKWYGKDLIQSSLGIPLHSAWVRIWAWRSQANDREKAFTNVMFGHYKWQNNTPIELWIPTLQLTLLNHCSQGTACRRYCVKST